MKIVNGSMNTLTLIAFGWLVLGMPVQAASFDCAKVSTRIETMICGDAALSKLDDGLTKAYQQTLEQSTDKQETINEQRLWLNDVLNVCLDEECLKNAYKIRTQALQINRTKEVGLKKMGSVSAQEVEPLGKYVLRATSGLSDNVDYKGFCASFTANLNEFKNLSFDTCDPRLSTKYPQFSRPQWEEIPLDMDIVKKILGSSPDMKWENWLKATEAARAANEVKLWHIQVDLMKDGNLDTLVRLDHYQDIAKPYCGFYESRQIIVNIPNPEISKWFTYAHFDDFERLGGDMIFDATTKRYFMLHWNRYGRALGGGKTLSDIGASASVMVSGVNQWPGGGGVWPVCWIDWISVGHIRHSNKTANKRNRITFEQGEIK